MPKKQYISTLNTRGADRRVIVAGVVFEKHELNDDTFTVLKGQGYIKEYTPSSPVVVVEGVKEGRKNIGPVNHTPSAALEGKQVDTAPRRRKPVVVKAQKTFTVRSGKKAAEPQQAAKVTPGLVWDAPPEAFKDATLPQLLAVYKEQCTKYNLPVETYTDRDLLIEKMSSEYAGN